MTAFPQAIVTVDVVLVTLKDGHLQVALFERENEPFKGVLALPGGYIHPQEDASAKAAAERVLREKTGIKSPYLEEFGTISGPDRDPRGWSLSVVHFALVPFDVLGEAVPLYPLHKLPHSLAFDHRSIVTQVTARIRSKASYSSLPVHLAGKKFTIPELHAIYELVLDEAINLPAFRRKIEDMDVLEPLEGETRQIKGNRPAQLYRQRPQLARQVRLRDRTL